MLSITMKTFQSWPPLRQWLAQKLRLDVAPVIMPLPKGYSEQRALPFLWDIIRSMLLGRSVTIVAAAIVSQIFVALQPLGMGMLIDSLNQTLIAPNQPDKVALALATLAIFWIGGAVFLLLAELITVYVRPQLKASIKARLFQHLMGQSPHYFQENMPGRLAQKVTQAANSGANVYYLLTIQLLQTFVLTLSACILISTLSTDYGLILGLWTLIFIATTLAIGLFGINWSKGLQNAISKVSGQLVDSVNNWDIVRSFARVDHEQRNLATALNDEASWIRRVRLFFISASMLQFGLGIVLMGWLVLKAIADTRSGNMTVGEFTMVCALGMQMFAALRTFSNNIINFFSDYGALKDGIELIMQPHGLSDDASADQLIVKKGGIEFQNMSFVYPNGTRVFDDLNLVIQPGEKIGLVGVSGSGKTTLTRLLTRQYEPDKGCIQIDGQDITHVTLNSLNQAIGMVSQTPNMFHRSVGANIAYGASEASDHQIWQAAASASCVDFIKQRDEGLATLMGEKGLKFSGGERQRLAIARVLLKDAPILLLDEATSSLDSHAEAAIQEALKTLMAGRTVIAIAHRLSTLIDMDRLLVIEAGRFVEEGSHHELLRRGGAYAALWERQQTSSLVLPVQVPKNSMPGG